MDAIGRAWTAADAGRPVRPRRPGRAARVRGADRRARRGLGPFHRPGRDEARRAGAGASRAGTRAQASHRQHARRHRRDGPRGRHPVRDAVVRGGDGLVSGRSCWSHSAFDFIHPQDVDRVREELGRTTRRTGHSSSTYRFRKKDGGWLWSDSLATLVRGEDGEPAGLVITSRDVTAKKRAEEVVALLHETERSLLRRESLETILARICARVADLFAFPAVWIGLKEPDGRIEPRAVAGEAAGFVTGSTFRWDDAPEGRGPSGEAVRTGRQQLVDTLEDPRVAPGKARRRRSGLGAALAVPLVANERVLGVLSCYAGKAGLFDEATVAPIARFADQVALSSSRPSSSRGSSSRRRPSRRRRTPSSSPAATGGSSGSTAPSPI